MTHVEQALAHVDWELLAKQKQSLIVASGPDDFIGINNDLVGLLHFLDAIQDAAELDGHPVVFLTAQEES